ncbi:MAG: M16 family metallopeptidase [Reyranella sp.]|uniref:M16 family metallopeptidase n=1 Tax=Reyranella sp. TaxID=1929291 RepID=UPI003D09ECDA
MTTRRRLLGTALASTLLGLPRAAGAVDINVVTTRLGQRVWLVRDESAPTLSVSFSVPGGTASDPAGQSGVTNLMATLLTDGAGWLGAQAFRQSLEEAAASLKFGASLDRLGGSLRVLTATRDEGFELLRLALNQARFEPDMIEQRRMQTIASLNQASQRPSSVAARTLMATVFEAYPYAANPDGTADDLRKLTTQDFEKRAAAMLERRGLVIAVVGDIASYDLARQLDHAFGGLPAGTLPPALPEWKPPARPRTVVVERPVPQSTALLALPGVLRNDPDWYAAVALNHILGGGGQQSRLFTEVREKRGLAYGASSSLRAYHKAGLIVISTASANERIAEALAVVRNVLARLRADGPTERELADAKTYLGGALSLSLDSSPAIAGLLLSMQVDNLSPDHLTRRDRLIEAVTIDDVRRLARRLLNDELLTTVVVGKPAGIVTDP